MNRENRTSIAFRLQPCQHRIPLVFAFEYRRSRREPQERNISCFWSSGVSLSGKVAAINNRDSLLLETSFSPRENFSTQLLVYFKGIMDALQDACIELSIGDTIRITCVSRLPADFIFEVEPKINELSDLRQNCPRGRRVRKVPQPFFSSLAMKLGLALRACIQFDKANDVMAVIRLSNRRILRSEPELSFGPSEWHMSGQRWRATRCDGAGSKVRGFWSAVCSPRAENALLPRTLVLRAGEGGGRGLRDAFTCMKQDNCAAGDGLK